MASGNRDVVASLLGKPKPSAPTAPAPAAPTGHRRTGPSKRAILRELPELLHRGQMPVGEHDHEDLQSLAGHLAGSVDSREELREKVQHLMTYAGATGVDNRPRRLVEYIEEGKRFGLG